MASPNASAITLCGARTRSGAPCRASAMPNGRCRMHGGKSLRGIASPTFKDGRRSKYMPSRLLETYRQGLTDKELLDLQDEISLIDARLNDVLGRVDTGEAGIHWHKMREAYDLLIDSLRRKSPDDQRQALHDLDDLTRKGQADWQAWHEIMALIEQRRKLVEAEQKRRISMQQMITAEQAMALTAAILETVKRNVTDRTALNAIQADVTRLITQDVR